MKRIEIFEANTKPAIEYFKTKIEVDNIDGIGSIDEITEKINLALKKEDGPLQGL